MIDPCLNSVVLNSRRPCEKLFMVCDYDDALQVLENRNEIELLRTSDTRQPGVVG